MDNVHIKNVKSTYTKQVGKEWRAENYVSRDHRLFIAWEYYLQVLSN